MNSTPPSAAMTMTPRSSLLYRGVRLEADGLWAAYVSEGDQAGRLIGHFRNETKAALAHDRVAVFLGDHAAGSWLNFPPSFSAMERLFLRRHCTEGFVFRAVLDETYDVQYEGFLRAEFEAYWWRKAGEETSRAVEECLAREHLRYERRGGLDKEMEATHLFAMGHLNPVLCSTWVAFFHEMGEPNRSFFTCEEAHEWYASRRRRLGT